MRCCHKPPPARTPPACPHSPGPCSLPAALLLLDELCRQEGEWPTYGNDDDRVDSLARDLVAAFHAKLAAQHTYRAALPTLRCVAGWGWEGWGSAGVGIGWVTPSFISAARLPVSTRVPPLLLRLPLPPLQHPDNH